MSIYDMFVLLYFALDSEHDENPNDDLDMFLSDANPFVFKGECSADPSIFENFKSAFEEYGTYDLDGFLFVSKFVEKECSDAVKNAFANIRQPEWADACNRYLLSKTA